MVSKNMVSIGVGIRRGRSNANRETDQRLLSLSDNLDYVEEYRTVFLWSDTEGYISIKCTRISIEENRFLFRCPWNGSSCRLFETCKTNKEIGWEKCGSINNSIIKFEHPNGNSHSSAATLILFSAAVLIATTCSPSSAALIYFPRSFRLPYALKTSYLPFCSRKLFLPIVAFRPVFSPL